MAAVSLRRLGVFGPFGLVAAGCLSVPPPPGDTGCGDEDAVALYTFGGTGGSEGRSVVDLGRDPPLHLEIRDLDAVEWLNPGLSVSGETLITSRGDTRKIVSAAQDAGALTVEAWVMPLEPVYDHPGPARIVTMSRGTRSRDRNFTIGQAEGSPSWDSISARIRDPEDHGHRGPEAKSDGELAIRERATHIVATFTEDEVLLVVDGAPFSAAPGADFSTWATFPLNLANEFDEDGASERPFLGEYYRVALYAREMSFGEIECRAQARPLGAP